MVRLSKFEFVYFHTRCSTSLLAVGSGSLLIVFCSMILSRVRVSDSWWISDKKTSDHCLLYNDIRIVINYGFVFVHCTEIRPSKLICDISSNNNILATRRLTYSNELGNKWQVQNRDRIIFELIANSVPTIAGLYLY